ncbi:gamma-glutamyltransferase [Leucobacter sp. CSA1]|uniref:Glutathione hydrolase proenzyme n=1 Tax=Leucobacter chromiisoli TaxID=2796471 RepID=A0A934Q6V9_9MICO|nr:gamma-glutamyltransferase [Leucobacter chromiisoli]MBK0418528.1 gamma-glutamyltransferase [Leucobacter chromiisoli]
MHADGPLTGRPPAVAERGMVATPHALATEAGVVALRRGGSAVDAAIAANAVLCVVYPHMAGLGGDAFALIKRPGTPLEALNASGPAGAAAHRDWYAQRGWTDAIPDRGPAAALTVPGAVDGWRIAHERHGRLDWSELFADAIRLAREGFAVGRSLASWYPKDAGLLRDCAESSRVFLSDGRPLRLGERLRNPDLARTLELVADRGARGAFYEGEVAERLCAGIDGSPLEPDDFAGYAAEWVDPILGGYRGKTVAQLPPNTQGFTVLQILGMIENYDVASWSDLGVDYLHHVIEATKLSFADRDAWLTDPDHEHVPVEELLGSDYLRGRSAEIARDASLDMGDVPSGVPGGWTGERAVPGGDTCYLSAVDEDGTFVSLIQSIYHDFGSGVVAEGTGVLLQNRGSFFELDAEHHNSLEPDKRTFHTLIPAMMLDGDEPWAALGSMGGEGQPQTQVAMITRMLDFGYDVQQAIEAPRWLTGRTWGSESQDLWLEGRIPDPVVHELERLGQPVRMLPDWDDNTGHAQAIRRTENGFLEGGADPRGDGLALGY